jgi:prolyl-tRNA editing enzyme YbaK/EbsC (Cys-tRNA(Pro) deacylase)
LAELVGLDKLALADPETVLKATGFPAGGVAPVLHASAFPVVVDERVIQRPVVFGGGGEEALLLRIPPAAIVTLTGAIVADIMEPLA